MFQKLIKTVVLIFNKNQIIIRVDKKYIRPAEVEVLHGNSTLARKELKWQPKITFKELVSEMMEKDLKLVKEKIIIDNYRNNSSSEKIMRKATNSSIFIAGHKGMLGSAIYNKLKSLGYKRIITKTKKRA